MINVYPVRAFKDNYIWVLHDDVHAIAVDPGISDPVIHYLQTNKLKLVAILVTHHHHDHTGGDGLVSHVPMRRTIINHADAADAAEDCVNCRMTRGMINNKSYLL